MQSIKKNSIFDVFIFILTAIYFSNLNPVYPSSGFNGSQRHTPLVKSVQKVFHSVVSIHSKSKEIDVHASGVIIDIKANQVLILTAEHVTAQATSITISIDGNESYPATLVASDSKNDLALLLIKSFKTPSKAIPISFAKVKDLLLGEMIIAVGNPFGLDRSIAAGILSATNRRIYKDKQLLFDGLLQTDLSLNPGHSGGPLINLDGDLIGINLAIKDGAHGITFATPIETIEKKLAEWILPIHFGNSICGLIPATRITEEGKSEVYVKALSANSPAIESGLKIGDIIKTCNGIHVSQAIELNRQLWNLKENTTITLRLENNTLISFPTGVLLKIMDPTSHPSKLMKYFDISIIPLTKNLAAGLGCPDYVHGFIVTQMDEQSILKRYGVQRGDIIGVLNHIPLFNSYDLYRVESAIHQLSNPLSMTIYRKRSGSMEPYRYVTYRIEIPLLYSYSNPYSHSESPSL